jgi:hypothetical protein
MSIYRDLIKDRNLRRNRITIKYYDYEKGTSILFLIASKKTQKN